MDIQTQGYVGGGVLVAIIGFFARNFHGRFQRVERTFITAAAVATLLKASEERFTLALKASEDRFAALSRESEQRIDTRHLSNEHNFREVRGALTDVNSKLFELAKQKAP